MATIGLDKLYYAPITEDSATGYETYGTPVMLAKAISAELSIELAEGTLWADDGAADTIKEFKSGTLTLGVDDIGKTVAAKLTGATIDENGVLISASGDGGEPVAIGFRAKKANGKYRYFWIYRVKFSIPSTNLATKGDSITFSTPSIEGTVFRRNKPDGNGRNPWKAEVNEDDTDVPQGVINGWYTAVYEPSFNVPNTNLSALSLGSLTLTPTFSAAVTSYTATTSNATNTITATAADENASVAITANGTTVQGGSAITWEEGENVVVVTVTNGTATKTYTITVTKEA